MQRSLYRSMQSSTWVCCLFEELFVHFLDVQGIFDSAAHIVANHELCQLSAINQNYTFAKKICSLLRRNGECRCRNKKSFCRFVAIQAAEKISNCTCTYAVADSISFCLNINTIETKGILIDDSINSVISRAPQGPACFLLRATVSHAQKQVNDQALEEFRWSLPNSIKQVLR